MLGGIPVHKAAAIVLRYVFLGRSEVPLDQLEVRDRDAVVLFTRDVEVAANDAARDEDDGSTIGVRRLHREWVEAATELLESTLASVHHTLSRRGRAVDPFVTWLEHEVGRFVNDPHDPFDEIAETAMSATEALYAPLGLTAAHLRSRVARILDWTFNRPARVPHAGGVSAVTERRSNGVIRVRTKVCPRHFDRSCILALPYIMLHEYICHAARFVLGGPAPSSATSLFTEGWMDFVTAGVHDHAADATKSVKGCWLDFQGHRRSARLRQEARLSASDHGDGIADGRPIGWRAAQRLDEGFGDRSAAWRPLWSPSVRLNGSALPDHKLDAFALAVHQILPPPGGAPGPAAIRLHALLHDAGLSPGRLVDQTLALAP